MVNIQNAPQLLSALKLINIKVYATILLSFTCQAHTHRNRTHMHEHRAHIYTDSNARQTLF